MNRRKLLQQVGLASGAWFTGGFNSVIAGGPDRRTTAKPLLTVAHITDVHIRQVDNAPARFKACLEQVKKTHAGFYTQ